MDDRLKSKDPRLMRKRLRAVDGRATARSLMSIFLSLLLCTMSFSPAIAATDGASSNASASNATQTSAASNNQGNSGADEAGGWTTIDSSDKGGWTDAGEPSGTGDASNGSSKDTLTETIITADNEHFTVRVTYGDDANIPDGAELSVTQIVEEPQGYDPQEEEFEDRPSDSERFISTAALSRRAAQLADAFDVDLEEESLFDAQFLDIALLSGGSQVEPAAPVKVTVETDAIDLETSEDVGAAQWGEKAKGKQGFQRLETDAVDASETAGANRSRSGRLARVSFTTQSLDEVGLAGVASSNHDGEGMLRTASLTPGGTLHPLSDDPPTVDANVLDKRMSGFNGNHATYTVEVNNNKARLADGDKLTLKDTFSVEENQSINYGSVEITTDPADAAVSYDYRGYTGTFSIPDETHVTITYTTRVKGAFGSEVGFSSSALLEPAAQDGSGATYSATTNERETLYPTGSDISGSAGVYTIDILTYGSEHMETGLAGAAYRLLDSNQRPITYKAGDNIGEEVVFRTGDDGRARVLLTEDEDGVSIHKNTVYYLEMTEAPTVDNGDGTYTYYRKDNNLYNFLITDDPSYSYGEEYSFFNGDVLKVRCYPESAGVNVTKRFSGNYALTDEQKNSIWFVLEKEKLDGEGDWEEIERHAYSEFTNGTMNFDAGKEGGTPLEDTATYHVVEVGDDVESLDLSSGIDHEATPTVTYRSNGETVVDQNNEFLVNPDSLAYSFNIVYDNKYIDHKLVITKQNEETGEVLPGATFTVYAASDDTTAVQTYTTEVNGAFTIRKGDGDGYASDTLYYAVETDAPDGYLLPANPEKTYFYFSENSTEVPAGLPSGKQATDLSTSFDAITVANNSSVVHIPVTATWELAGSGDEWPQDVASITVGLYQSVDGKKPTPVLDENDAPRTVVLTSATPFDNGTFVGLPAQNAEGKTITYSIVEESVTGVGGGDLTDQYAPTYSVSGTGWYVVKNQEATSIQVAKEWYDIDGQRITDASGKPPVSFDVYQLTENKSGSYERADLEEIIGSSKPIRTGIELSAEGGWTSTVKSLPAADGHYYIVLESKDSMPANHEDTYEVVAAQGDQPCSIAIKNTQTPTTVTVSAQDLSKTYGDADPSFDFKVDVQDDEATAAWSGPDEGGNYTVAITKSGKTKNIQFTCSRVSGEDKGTYVITPDGSAEQEGFRVKFENATLTVNRAEATVRVGASKLYGDADPALATIEGLKNDDDPTVISYDAMRDPGEDVGTYEISASASAVQGNYTVVVVPGVFVIERAPVVVKADDDLRKIYGSDDPDLTVSITGLKNDDDPTVISYEISRAEGDDVGTYTVTPTGDAEQGNYSVTYENGQLEITGAPVIVKVEDAEKAYGEPDPTDWNVTITGLQGADPESLISYTVSRASGEEVGSYAVTPSGDAVQGNYLVTFFPGTLTIGRAQLVVTADDVAKINGDSDPDLTATPSGLKNGDENVEPVVAPGTGANAGKFVWTYTRDGETDPFLTFVLSREAGEDDGSYTITAEGEAVQGDYDVTYEDGTFTILQVFDVDVTQVTVDPMDSSANPPYEYTATLDLSAIGFDTQSYTRDGFVGGVCTFGLPGDDEDNPNLKNLKVPEGATLTVVQSANEQYDTDYDTSVAIDGVPYSDPDGEAKCTVSPVDNYYAISFTHSRDSLPVQARAGVDQTEEGAKAITPSGYMGVPADAENGQPITSDYVENTLKPSIGYQVPTDKYYEYNHASLYTASGQVVEGAVDVAAVRYVSASKTWEYKVGSANFAPAPAGARLVLFYYPKYVCKVGDEKFYSINAAFNYIKDNEGTFAKTGTIEMLLGEYAMPASDALTVPFGYDIIITTAQTEYEGTQGTKAKISRGADLTSGAMFANNGTLSFDDITLDGKGVSASVAMVTSGAQSSLTVGEGATLTGGNGVNGGAIYVQDADSVVVNGNLTGNSATNGGALYVASGTAEVGGDVSDNSATNGGALYVAGGTVTVVEGAEVSGNSATDGGALYVAGGTVTIAEGATATGNTASDAGGAAYVTGGTLNVDGALSGNSAVNGGAVYKNGGALDVSTTGNLSDNEASANGGAVYSTDNVTFAGTMSGNEAAENGGAIYMSGGTLTSSGQISGNSAANGGAIYLANGTLNQEGGTVSGNTATTGSGGALYLSNAKTTISSAATLSGNAAAQGNGGVAYIEGGTFTVEGNSTLGGGSAEDSNTAVNGGAVYATSGSITVKPGSITGNAATGSGGAIYTKSASVHVEGGEITNNTASGATSGDTIAGGGGIFTESGSVAMSGGKLNGNVANGEGALGGAVYAGTGTITYSGGEVKTNQAANGSAFYVGSGVANISAGNITTNVTTGTSGGAIGIGGTSVRLNFSGGASVTGNTMSDGKASNVYLNVDSENVINYEGNSSANNRIGVHVPGDYNSDLVVKHGDVCGFFGVYTTNTNAANVFKNDRFSALEVEVSNNSLSWKFKITCDAVYLSSFKTDAPPTPNENYSNATSTPNGYYQRIKNNVTYYPKATESSIYDIVTDMGIASPGSSLYAYTYANTLNTTKFDTVSTRFDDFLSSVQWSRTSDTDGKWAYKKQNGDDVTNARRIVIVYSDPAYLTIVNNTGDDLTLNINDLIVQGSTPDDAKNCANTSDENYAPYGYITAYNGASAQTLTPINPSPATESEIKDLVLAPGESRKILFPGAVSKTFTLGGVFTGTKTKDITYTMTGVSGTQTLTTTQTPEGGYAFSLPGSLRSNSNSATEIVFGTKPYICKIGNEKFQTLTAAKDYMVSHGAGTYKVEMLVDYLVPVLTPASGSTPAVMDALNIPNGYNVTFTTAEWDDPSNPDDFGFTGKGIDDIDGDGKKEAWAVISRDVGNSGPPVSSGTGSLTVENMVFDGLAVAGNGSGGAVSVKGANAAVTIQYAKFQGYRANQGGAVFVDNRPSSGSGGSLTIDHVDFTNCQTSAAKDKDGGGGVWTTAKTLSVTNCNFDSCACTKAPAQAGAVFHNIQSGWSSGSTTDIKNCYFQDCYAVGGSGGTIETDALTVTIEGCQFHGSYANKQSGANGGAVNTWTNNQQHFGGDTSITVKDCWFDGAAALNGGNGGALRITTTYAYLENCKFTGSSAKMGGAVTMDNNNAKYLEIKGCTFENCTATGNGGGVNAPVLTVEIKDSEGGTFLDGSENDGHTRFLNCSANVGGGLHHSKTTKLSIENSKFENCVAKTGSGGGVFTNAKDFSITGTAAAFDDPDPDSNMKYSSAFINCTAQGPGGGVYQNQNSGSKAVLENCLFSGCAANNGGNGGGVYTNAPSLTVQGTASAFKSCVAQTSGGGLYHDNNVSASTATIANCEFNSCVAEGDKGGGLYTKAKALTVSGEGSKYISCVSQNNGGGVYHDPNSNVESSAGFTDCTFDGCETSGPNGGAIYVPAKTVTVSGCSIKNSTAVSAGGGLYMSPTNASIAGCTFSGNNVTGADSRGGGIYINTGTITYETSKTYDCTSAGNGGGIYLYKGTLTVRSGVVSGQAINGGGVFVFDSSARVNQEGGAVGGTASSNGGGVYLNNGAYTMGGDASIGGPITVDVVENGNTTSKSISSSAVNGGGVYLARGTFTQNGGSIGGTKPGEQAGEVSYTATAAYGGGVYLNGGTFNFVDGSIEGAASNDGGGVWNGGTFTQSGGTVVGIAANGGGVYQSNTYSFNGGGITGIASGNGGGVYQAANTFNIDNGATIGKATRTDGTEIASSASNGGGLYVAGGTANLYEGGLITGATATNGGGAYVGGGAFYMGVIANNAISRNGGDVVDNSAQNGGGVYVADGTFALREGGIAKNEASANGGGVYVAGGTVSLNGGSIGGSEELGNSADTGGGVYVAAEQTVSINDWVKKDFQISYNHAATAGGGVAAGDGAVLSFRNYSMVRHNTTDGIAGECNVYLAEDSNTVIQSASLSDTASIGVYVSDDQVAAHGLSGMPFGTHANSANLKCFVNDRKPFLYGMEGSDDLTVWASFVCKITDADGNMLYTEAGDAEGLHPAVYLKLETSGGATTDSAFGVLLNDTPTLYAKGRSTKYSGQYQIQMFVQEYQATSQIKISNNKTITLTTASSQVDEYGLYYKGDPKHPNATVIRNANYGSMFSVESGSLTYDRIIVDGGSENGFKANTAGGIAFVKGGSAITVGENAKLCNSTTTHESGGAIRMQDSENNTATINGDIDNCSSGKYGGAISVKAGTLTINSGTISNCSSQYGGAVRMDKTMYMNGGIITENTATKDGGGISTDDKNSNVRLYFSGDAKVVGNVLNGDPCNVQLCQNSDALINADGLTGRAEIGVYTPEGDIRNNRGVAGKDFGTWASDANLHCFVNDLNANLRGAKHPNISSQQRIWWQASPILEVSKEAVSDWSADKTRDYNFKVVLSDTSVNETYDGVKFTNGEASFTLTGSGNGNMKSFVLPARLIENSATYEVTEELNETESGDFDTTVSKDGGEPVVARKASGTFGENITDDEDSTSVSAVEFTNTRKLGELSLSKFVTSFDESDFEIEFPFVITLGDSSISKAYDYVDADGQRHEGGISFENGVANWGLADSQSITIEGLPKGIPYTVLENPSAEQRTTFKTKSGKKADGSDAEFTYTQTGTVGENTETRTSGDAGDEVTVEVYTSAVFFFNSHMSIVCKITDSRRNLLYVREGDNLSPAIYDKLEDAFAQVNAGGLRTAKNGTATGTFRIEMVVKDYSMEGAATLDSGKTVILSTALTGDERYPYNDGKDDGHGNIALVSRGFDGGSMIVDSGALTIDKITLDGNAQEFEASGRGGIVQVNNNVALTVNDVATLRNSTLADTTQTDSETGEVTTTLGAGGAIWLHSGSRLVLNGTVENCNASQGGGVYAEERFGSITVGGTGEIANCSATGGNGGAINASSGGTVTVNAGASLTGNTANSRDGQDDSGKGGAIFSNANVTIKGNVGGTGEGEGNTADRDGGGVYLGPGATFTMSAGQVSGNTATNGDGGGLAAQGAVKISGGTFAGNSAPSTADDAGRGGAIFASGNATVAISGSTTAFTGNQASQGGAVYDQASMTMSGGSMTGNSASDRGGAVYVADGHSFTMSGGSITGNQSPQGAVSTGEGGKLVFSGAAVVTGNTLADGTTPANVYLGYDDNTVINTPGLGAAANIGVYVANGQDDAIYYEHGIAGRNFATYTGTSLSSANLGKFSNDRDATLPSVAGAQKTSPDTGYFVMWAGKHLLFDVFQMAKGGVATTTPVARATFTLTNAAGDVVWTGASTSAGRVDVPWAAQERSGGNAATFAANSEYVLAQTATGNATVRPAGSWKVAIGRDNSVTWTVQAVDGEVNRTLDVLMPLDGEGNAKDTGFIGEVFRLFNDVKPVVTFNAAGGKLSDGNATKEATVGFTTTETSHSFDIEEKNPTRDSFLFLGWADADDGVVDYAQGDSINFYRHTDDDDITLYAVWQAVVCKITDRNNNLLYVNGDPAVYLSLKDGFAAFNHERFTASPTSTKSATPRKIQMLVETYVQREPVTLERGKTGILTTAKASDKDGYPYTGEGSSISTIERGFNGASMITNLFNLSLTNITLDGNKDHYTANVDGGIINIGQSSAQLTVGSGATLTNARTSGNGGAINAVPNTKVSMSGGEVSSSSAANGGALYADTRASVALSGGTLSGNRATYAGGAVYAAGNAKFDLGGATLNSNNATNGGALFADANASVSLRSGAITSNSVTGSGGGVYISSGSNLAVMGVRLSGNSATGNGGAVYLANLGKMAMTSGEMSRNSAAAGGAAYIERGGELALTGGTFSGNSVTASAGGASTGGAGVHLADGAKLNISGKPAFSSNAKQDIYLAEGGEEDSHDPADIVVSGNLTGAKGSIYVWAENEWHYKQLMPFAKLGNGVTLSEDAAAVFYNGRDDDDTENGTGEELHGTLEGEKAGFVYWNGFTGSRPVILRKVNEDYESLGGATFTLYRKQDTSSAVARDLDKNPLQNLASQAPSGVIWTGDLPYGTYYMYESAAPSSYASNEGVWFKVTVDDAKVLVERLGTVSTITGYSISLSTNAYTVGGATGTAVLNASYSDGTVRKVEDGVSWSSSDSSIATVDDSGVVTPVAAGSAEIIATVDGNEVARASVEVSAAIIPEPTGPTEGGALTDYEWEQLHATFTNRNGDTQIVKPGWFQSDRNLNKWFQWQDADGNPFMVVLSGGGNTQYFPNTELVYYNGTYYIVTFVYNAGQDYESINANWFLIGGGGTGHDADIPSWSRTDSRLHVSDFTDYQVHEYEGAWGKIRWQPADDPA